jgi:Zn-finger protein
MLEKQAQFVLSGHRIGEFTLGREEWGNDCVRCHTPIGFQQFAELGEANITGGITNTDHFDCSTCHGIHNEFLPSEFALRLTDPVVAVVDGATFDLRGHNNLCGNCHQARTAEPNIASPGETFKITSTHYGPHHGPQANTVYGMGYAEIPGSVAYPAAGSSKHLAQASCIGCHMAPFNNGEGGHSFAPSLKACNDCHGASLTDFNYGGVRSDVEAKLEELRDMLIELGVVAGDDENGYHPVTGTYPMLQVQAFFNWIGLEEDRSLGAHNPPYVRALLINTKEALEAEIAKL